MTRKILKEKISALSPLSLLGRGEPPNCNPTVIFSKYLQFYKNNWIHYQLLIYKALV
jgi:hypothetical protein